MAGQSQTIFRLLLFLNKDGIEIELVKGYLIENVH